MFSECDLWFCDLCTHLWNSCLPAGPQNICWHDFLISMGTSSHLAVILTSITWLSLRSVERVRHMCSCAHTRNKFWTLVVDPLFISRCIPPNLFLIYQRSGHQWLFLWWNSIILFELSWPSVCECCSSHSGVEEDFGLPRHNAVYIGV